jgi:hypothetical protein
MPRGVRGLTWQVQDAAAVAGFPRGDCPLMSFDFEGSLVMFGNLEMCGEFRFPDGRPMAAYEHLCGGVFVSDIGGTVRSPTFTDRPDDQPCRWHVLRLVPQAPPRLKLIKRCGRLPDEMSSEITPYGGRGTLSGELLGFLARRIVHGRWERG